MKNYVVCSFCYIILRSCGVMILLCYFENYIIIIIFSCAFCRLPNFPMKCCLYPLNNGWTKLCEWARNGLVQLMME
uniref:Predicted protein n=1 Tax=Hordeum vulgare subsp. vulgare TaxID=112509 RepID=F2EA60_HORVV|nr:predicted protein [Hordeum vulgare subsp. vulgare]